MGNCTSLAARHHPSPCKINGRMKSKTSQFNMCKGRPVKGNSLKMKMSEFSLNGFEKNADRTVVPDEHSWIYSSLMKKKPFDALSADALNAIALSFFPIDVSPNSEVAVWVPPLV